MLHPAPLSPRRSLPGVAVFWAEILVYFLLPENSAGEELKADREGRGGNEERSRPRRRRPAPTQRDGSSGCGPATRLPPQRLRPRPGAEGRDGMSRLPLVSRPPPRLPEPPSAPLRNCASRSLRGGQQTGSAGQNAVREGATERRGGGSRKRKAGVCVLCGKVPWRREGIQLQIGPSPR